MGDIWVSLGGESRIAFIGGLGMGDGRIRCEGGEEIGLRKGIQGETAGLEGHLMIDMKT